MIESYPIPQNGQPGHDSPNRINGLPYYDGTVKQADLPGLPKKARVNTYHGDKSGGGVNGIDGIPRTTGKDSLFSKKTKIVKMSRLAV
jgi:hypothetical protein